MRSKRLFSAASVLVVVGFLPAFLTAQPKATPRPEQPKAGDSARVSAANSGAPFDTTASSPGPLTFLPALNYSASPFSIVIADVNHDHKPDLIVSGSGVSVLLGNGDGTFQPAVGYYTGGTGSFAVAVGDFNRDGNLDLAVTVTTPDQGSGPDGVVGILLGNGDGTFQPAVTYDSLGSVPVSIAVADINNDKKPDVLVLNECAHQGCVIPVGTLTILPGNGDGTFQPGVSEGFSGYYGSWLAVGDIDGDGNIDVAAASLCAIEKCAGDGQVNVGFSDGELNFTGLATGWSGSGPLSYVAIADVNGDGRPDLLALGLAGEVGVFLNRGGRTFLPVATYNLPIISGGMAVADVNRDRHPDLLFGAGEGSLIVMNGNGDGTFQSPVVYDPGGSTGGTAGIAVGDLNGDGLPDVVVANQAAGAVGVFLNNIAAPSSTIVLSPSVNPVNILKPVTYTATVADRSARSLSGTVTFWEGGYPLATSTLANNQASFTTSYARKQAGVHTITAIYGGEYKVATGRQSAPLTEYVRASMSHTQLTSSTSPSLVGQSVTFTATVTSGSAAIPDGEGVTFTTGKTVLGTGLTTNGVASLATTFSQARTYEIKATYAGDDIFEPSSGLLKQVVSR